MDTTNNTKMNPFEENPESVMAKAITKLIDQNEIFADMISSWHPDFKTMKPSELETLEIFSPYEEIPSDEYPRDQVTKIWKVNGTPKAVVQVAVLTKPDPAIASSLMVDAGNIIFTWNDMFDLGAFPPLYQFVYYFGLEQPWDSAKDLYELWNIDKPDPALIGNLKPCVVDAGAWNTQELDALTLDDLKLVSRTIQVLREKVDVKTIKEIADQDQVEMIEEEMEDVIAYVEEGELSPFEATVRFSKILQENDAQRKNAFAALLVIAGLSSHFQHPEWVDEYNSSDPGPEEFMFAKLADVFQLKPKYLPDILSTLDE